MQMILIATILLIFYLVLIGLQDSISDSWYTRDYAKWLFFLVLGLVGIIIVAEVHPYTSTYSFHLAGLGTWLVAVAPNFKTKRLPKVLHFLGAGMVVVGGYLGIWLEFGCWVYSLILLTLSVAAYLIPSKRKLYWFEVVAFGGLLGFLNVVI